MFFKDVEFEIIRSSRRTMAIEVKTGGNVVVRVPKKAKDSVVESFLDSRYEWILKAVERQRARANKYDLSADEAKRLKELAKSVIPDRVQYFSNVMGLRPTGVKITSAKTRFGSCSANNSLNFSFYLMGYPMEAVDYVVVHELAHIRHKNHQKEFYVLIERYLPDYKMRAALLKK